MILTHVFPGEKYAFTPTCEQSEHATDEINNNTILQIYSIR